MNTFMYTHPLTAKQLKIVTEELGYTVVGPQGSKGLACGDVGACALFSRWRFMADSLWGLPGVGAMTEWTEIVQIIRDKEASRHKDVDPVSLKPELPFYSDCI